MHVNQQGHPVDETAIAFRHLTLEEKYLALDLLFQHLGLAIVQTNATKYGNFELELHKKE
jgi:hypothetical protein